ncbi:MAG: TIGR03089 family protein [Candidatus Nanopelagicales bacterium]
MRDPAAPFVTYYDAATSERVELSGTTFGNWVSKTSNMLVDEFDVEPGSVVNVRLPLHWILPVWIAACWQVGATVAIGAQVDAPDIAVVGPQLVTADTGAEATIACSLLPMAQGFREPLQPQLTDYFTDVRNYGDFFTSASPVAADQDALIAGTESWNPAGLELAANNATARWQVPAAGRMLVTAAGANSTHGGAKANAELTDLDAVLATLSVPTLVAGSAVLVVNPGPEGTATIAVQERVTTQIDVT